MSHMSKINLGLSYIWVTLKNNAGSLIHVENITKFTMWKMDLVKRLEKNNNLWAHANDEYMTCDWSSQR